MPLTRCFSALLSLLALALCLGLTAPALALTVDFDGLTSGTDVAGPIAPGVRASSALVVDETTLGLLGFAATGTWATSGDTGLFNTLAPSIVFTLDTATSEIVVDVLTLADAAGLPFVAVLRGVLGSGASVEVASDPNAIGDSGFAEASLRLSDASGFKSFEIFTRRTDGSMTTGPTSSVFADSLRLTLVPEPQLLVLLSGALVAVGRARRKSGRRRRKAGAARRLASTLLLGTVALGMVGASCTPRPRVVAPADLSQADVSGAVPIDIRLGGGFTTGSLATVTLLTGMDEGAPTFLDITNQLALSGTTMTGNLSAADLRPGRSTLFVSVDANGDGAAENTTSSTFSYEPTLDPTQAVRCDPLDTTLCLLPFPSNHFTRPDATTPTGLRLNIDVTAGPQNASGKAVDTTLWNESDGFSIGPMILAHFPAPFVDLPVTGAPGIQDPRRCMDADSPVVLMVADTGERIPCWAELDDPVHAPTPAEQLLIIRPARNLAEGQRMIVALRNLQDATGTRLSPSRAFQLYRDGIPTFLPEFENRRANMEDVFTRLGNAGVARSELTLAWDFTTQSTESISSRLLTMRDDAFQKLGTNAPTFTITRVTDFTPAERARVFRRIQGSVSVPLYLDGVGQPGSLLLRDSNGLPFQNPANPTFNANFTCNLPRWILPADGSVRLARPSLYGHGLLGSDGEANASHVETMANTHGFVFCGVSFIGMSNADIITVAGAISDFSDFPKIPERLHQAMLNFLFVGRAMIHPDGFSSDPAFQVAGPNGMVSVLDTQELYYDGNSQGGIAGGALAAISQDATRFVLGVPGMNYSTLLKRSVDFDDFLRIVEINYPNPMDRTLLISLTELLWERTESNGHVNHLVANPYPGTPAKKLLLHVAFADHQVADVSAEIMARTMGAHLHTPALNTQKHTSVAPYWDIPAIPAYPFDGSAIIIWDSGNPASPTSNVPPRPTAGDANFSACALRFGLDPHECPRRQPAAQLQKSMFLAPNGAVFDTCSGTTPSACLADLLP